MKNNKGFAPILIIVIIAILAIGGYAYLSKNNSKKMDPIAEENTTDINDNKESSTSITSQTLTQQQAENLVHQTWSDCSQGDCASVEVVVTVNSNGQKIVTAIFNELDDSTSQTKKVSIATYQNGVWALGQPIVTYSCHRGHVDGSQGFSSSLCI